MESTSKLYIPSVQRGNNYIVGSINISLPAPGASIESYHIIDPCKTFFERSGGSKVIHHHIHDCSRMVRLTKELNNLRLKIVSKVKNTLVSIQRIIATTPNPHTYQTTSRQEIAKEFFRIASLHWRIVQCIIWDSHREGCPQSTGRRR